VLLYCSNVGTANVRRVIQATLLYCSNVGTVIQAALCCYTFLTLEQLMLEELYRLRCYIVLTLEQLYRLRCVVILF
jgi:hypothetical protein